MQKHKQSDRHNRRARAATRARIDTHTHTCWEEEEIPEATGGSGDSNQEDFDLLRASVIAAEMERLDQAHFQLTTTFMPRHRDPPDLLSPPHPAITTT